MALTVGSASAGTGLAGDLYSQGVSDGVLTANTSAEDFCDWLADVIIDHITSNGVVNPTALVAPSGGGPVTGTGTIS